MESGDRNGNNFWSGRRVFVTGATGIIGSWLVKELVARSATVAALVIDADPQTELYRSGDVERVHVVNGRLEDFATVERAIVGFGIDTVLHLGAQAIVEAAQAAPLATLETNVRGTWNVLEVCRQQSDLVKSIVVASSDKAYGKQEELPYREEMALRPTNPYEVSKGCADLIAQSYHSAYGLPVAIARCGNVYGGGDLNWSRIVPGTIRSLYRGELPVLRSDGNYIRDYIYVKDAVAAYLALAEALDAVSGQAFNFSTESRVPVVEIVERICRLMDAQHVKPVILNTARGEIRNQYLSAAKAARLLHWEALYSLDEGLRETIDWYKQYFLTGERRRTVVREGVAG